MGEGELGTTKLEVGLYVPEGSRTIACSLGRYFSNTSLSTSNLTGLVITSCMPIWSAWGGENKQSMPRIQPHEPEAHVQFP